MILHILTSAKGGVGKTLLALCIARHYLSGEGGNKVLGLDLNWVNPDLSRILSLETNWTFDRHYMKWTIYGARGIVLRPTYPFVIPLGSLGLWKQIGTALEICARDRHTVDYAVVETSAHIGNMVRRPGESYSTATFRTCQEINHIATKHGIERIYFWFVWTLAAMQSSEDIPAISLTIDDLALTECGFDAQKGLLHVLNPYALYSLVEVADIFRIIVRDRGKLEYRVPGLSDLQETQSIVKSIAFSDLDKRIIKPFLEKYKGAQISSKNLWDAFAKAILESEGGRPRNIIPIPTFSSQLVGYTDRFIRRPLTGLEHRDFEVLGDIYESIHRLLPQLE